MVCQIEMACAVINVYCFKRMVICIELSLHHKYQCLFRNKSSINICNSNHFRGLYIFCSKQNYYLLSSIIIVHTIIYYQLLPSPDRSNNSLRLSICVACHCKRYNLGDTYVCKPNCTYITSILWLGL